MDKAKKKNIRRAISLICVVALVAVLAAMPLIAKPKPEETGPKASILSGKAELGSLQEAILGGGTLTEEDGDVISIPSAVKLKSFLVSNGDVVTEGMPIATVDRVTVMTAITQVQETLEYLSEQITESESTGEAEEVTALAGGIVKVVYAQEGDSVGDVMLEHGALAVLSLDGLMAVDFDTTATLSSGTQVQVTLSDGETVTGKVTKNLAGAMTVTLEDDGYALGEAVTVTDLEGNAVGNGELYIYSPWSATAYAGTVEEIEISEGDETEAGDTLMTLTDVGSSAAYLQLIRQRQDYEKLMLDLFKMYQTETVFAQCDGVVSGVDENSLQLLSGDGEGYTLTFLNNAPSQGPADQYANYVAKIAMIAENGWVLTINPQAVAITDYQDLSNVDLDPAKMTQKVIHTQTQIPVYTLENGQWVESPEVKEGDLLLIAAAGQGRFIWCVRLQPQENQQPDTPATPDNPATPDTPERPGGSDKPSDPSTPEQEKPSGGQTGNESQGGSGNFPQGGTGNFPQGGTGSFPQGGTGSYPQGGTGSYPQDGMTFPEQEPEYELYGMDMTTIASVVPQNTMKLEITVDEQDVAALSVGMSAQIRIDALGGEKHEAIISLIGNTGTNNGGSSKFTVELTLNRGENMLSGMTATATVVLSETQQVLTLPAAALVEEGTRTLVYTGYNEEEELLLNPVEVTVGLSDGQTVQILGGLTQGQTYYYAYYDTLEASVTPDFGNSSLFGR